MISGRWTDFGATVADNQTALDFYLDRATRARLLLDGRRMQDVRMRSYRAAPVVVAAATGDLAAVAMLLRYGPDERSVRGAIAYLRSRSGDRDRDQSTLELLLRAVACERGTVDGFGSGDESGCAVDESGGNDDGSGCGVNVVPALLHLARCAVRKALHQNFSLPHGIPQLPVPRSLVSYLDLEC
ncbi:SOCS box domain-containing protein [Aphis craccivora]|uniref:SOCS box domain-containing protein n=1 Tax=Aphis craccivora TaxID=307492 RepID=A0A6G0YN37_APHCR|nr:SOCS box domain-containing protein [Aphis craccivora]